MEVPGNRWIPFLTGVKTELATRFLNGRISILVPLHAEVSYDFIQTNEDYPTQPYTQEEPPMSDIMLVLSC